jgi:two-component system CheB/CheR fusion protein
MQRSRLSPSSQALRSHEEERLLERLLLALADDFVPLAVVVNEQMEVLHIMGSPEDYFRLPTGKLSNDITKMADKSLSIPLATGLQKVFKSGEELKYTNIRIQSRDPYNEASRMVQMRIRLLPGKRNQELLAAVFIEGVQLQPKEQFTGSGEVYDVSQEAEQRIHDLEQELQFTRENLQATIEELETSNEELQATNEELLASNEELQSTNEELQSVNEELHTVNAEYQSKIIELTELTNDLDNLMASTRIGTLFLDENLEIRKFTPEAKRIFMILDSDIGRPVNHINHKLVDVDLLALIHKVERNPEENKLEVRSSEGVWYLMRILPYVVGQGVVSGQVLTFVDISPLKRMQAALTDSEGQVLASEERYTLLFNTMTEGVVYHNSTGEIISANPSAERILGLTIEEMTGRTSIDPRWRTIREDGGELPGSEHPAVLSLQTGRPVLGVLMGVYNPKVEQMRWIRVNAVPLFHAGEDKPFQVYTTFNDITDSLQSARELEQARSALNKSDE